MTYQDQDTKPAVSTPETTGKGPFQGQLRFRRPQPQRSPSQPMSPPVADPEAPEEGSDDAAPAGVADRPKTRWFQTWACFWLVLLLASGGAATAAFIWLIALPPVPNCQQPSTVVEESERLACAQQAAASGDLKALVAGVKLVQNWPKDNPRYLASQRLLANWSSSILLLARQKASQNQLRDAIATAKNIPSSSATYPEAQEAIASWQQELDRGQVIYDRAQAALRAQDWRRATEELQALGRLPNPIWRSRVTALRRQIREERVSRDRLREARNLAQTEDPNLLGQAITVAQTIGRDRYARPEAQADIGRWSRTLLNLAMQQWEQQDFAGARGLAEKIPLKSAVGDEARAFLQLCHAQEIVLSAGANPLNVEAQWLTLLEAVQIARRLPPTSPLVRQVKSSLPRWEASLQDLHQLQVAHTFAQVGQIATLQLAINQVGRLGPDRPRRLQAQTLMSHWRKEIQRQEDRPLLEQAKVQAQAGTPEGVRAAIAQASKIAPGRALRPDAQAAIAQWNRQLQQLQGPTQDRQRLTKAQSLAEWGNRNTAIEQARQIQPDSPLYTEAQAAIARWQEELNRSQNRTTAGESR